MRFRKEWCEKNQAVAHRVYAIIDEVRELLMLIRSDDEYEDMKNPLTEALLQLRDASNVEECTDLFIDFAEYEMSFCFPKLQIPREIYHLRERIAKRELQQDSTAPGGSPVTPEQESKSNE